MNPPSIVFGGGVHGKVCWLIAYRSESKLFRTEQAILSKTTNYLIKNDTCSNIFDKEGSNDKGLLQLLNCSGSTLLNSGFTLEIFNSFEIFQYVKSDLI